jgi:hypothetical protein
MLLAVVTFFYFGYFAVHDAREAARRSQCKNNLKQIGLALLNYHDTFGCFPPAHLVDAGGKPTHSWRVLITPFLDASPFYNQYRFDEPWDGPHNLELGRRHSSVWHCASDPFAGTQAGSMSTNYLAVIGPGAAWNGSTSVSNDDVTDPTSDTIMIVEVQNSGIHWMEPRDLQLAEMAPTVNARVGKGISSPHNGGAHVLTMDDSVRWVPNDTSATTIRALLTIRGGEKTSW